MIGYWSNKSKKGELICRMKATNNRPLHHGFRVVSPHGEEPLHQHRLVIHDALPQHHLYRHQQRLAATRPFLCQPHHQRGNETWFSYEGKNNPAHQRHVQEKRLQTDA